MRGQARPGATHVALNLDDAVLAPDFEIDVEGNANVDVLQRLRPAVVFQVGAVAAVGLEQALGVDLPLGLVLVVGILGGGWRGRTGGGGGGGGEWGEEKKGKAWGRQQENCLRR